MNKDLSNLKELYQYSLQVNQTLGQISIEMNKGELNWKELEADGSSLFAKEVSNPSKDGFDSIEHLIPDTYIQMYDKR